MQNRYARPLTLNEITGEIEEDEEVSANISISILPPEHCNTDVTDEDSGDESNVMIHNLPRFKLRAPAEFCYRSADCSDEDNDIPLIQISNCQRVTAEESAILKTLSHLQNQTRLQIAPQFPKNNHMKGSHELMIVLLIQG